MAAMRIRERCGGGVAGTTRRDRGRAPVVLVLAVLAACHGRARGGQRPDVADTGAIASTCPAGTRAVSAALAHWCEDSGGRRHGPARTAFDDGTPRSEGAYHEGQLHGTWRSYYLGGVLRSEQHYDQGRPVGTWTAYFVDGERASTAVHEPGGHIRVTEWRPGGAMLREGTTVAGERHGVWREWDAAGTELRSEWERGKPKTAAGAVAVIGIAECDEYLAKFARCLEERVPEASRAAMREAMQASAQAWREAAAGPGREGLATSCRAAVDAARQATAAMGCTW